MCEPQPQGFRLGQGREFQPRDSLHIVVFGAPVRSPGHRWFQMQPAKLPSSPITVHVLLSSKRESFLLGVGGFTQTASSLHLGFTLLRMLCRRHLIPSASAVHHLKHARRLFPSCKRESGHNERTNKAKNHGGNRALASRNQFSPVQTTTVQTKNGGMHQSNKCERIKKL